VRVTFGARVPERRADGVVSGVRWSVRYDGAELEITIERPRTWWRRFRAHVGADAFWAALVVTAAVAVAADGRHLLAVAIVLGLCGAAAWSWSAMLPRRRLALLGSERVLVTSDRLRLERDGSVAESAHRGGALVHFRPGRSWWSWGGGAWHEAELRGWYGRVHVEGSWTTLMIGAWVADDVGRDIVAAVALLDPAGR
jgi:hypothetical protein